MAEDYTSGQRPERSSREHNQVSSEKMWAMLVGRACRREFWPFAITAAAHVMSLTASVPHPIRHQENTPSRILRNHRAWPRVAAAGIWLPSMGARPAQRPAGQARCKSHTSNHGWIRRRTQVVEVLQPRRAIINPMEQLCNVASRQVLGWPACPAWSTGGSSRR